MRGAGPDKVGADPGKSLIRGPGDNEKAGPAIADWGHAQAAIHKIYILSAGKQRVGLEREYGDYGEESKR